MMLKTEKFFPIRVGLGELEKEAKDLNIHDIS